MDVDQSSLLGQLSPAHFLAEYWQKKPLIIRQAIPNFSGLLSPNELAGLACEDDVQSRIVSKISIDGKAQWALSHGPFDDATFNALPEQDWTLLVQSVNHFLPEASELLQQFNFIPQARLDDLMVSYAPTGGSVGPHFDSYDVFLLQGEGARLWQISDQSDLSLVDDAPLRILKNFHPSQEWLLEPGDMLYLPPQYAHWGTAQSEDCMTYSIGFRAPKQQELATEFLLFLQEAIAQESANHHSQFSGMYRDPDLTHQDNSAEISESMVKKVSDYLQKITWKDNDIATFIGQYTTEPKTNIVFEHNEALLMDVFKLAICDEGFVLDLKSQLLFHGSQFFINGETINIRGNATDLVKTLAHQRYLTPENINENLTALDAIIDNFYEWYQAGYCHLGID